MGLRPLTIHFQQRRNLKCQLFPPSCSWIGRERRRAVDSSIRPTSVKSVNFWTRNQQNWTQSAVAKYRDFKIRGRRRQCKRHRKSEFAFFQSSSRLLQVTNFEKKEVNPPKVEFPRTITKFRKIEEIWSSLVYFLCTRETRHFHVVVVQWRQKNAQKSVIHVQNCCFDY